PLPRQGQSTAHPLLGLCPVGLPGTGHARRAAEELVNATVVYVAMDRDEAGQKASDTLISELTRRQVTAIPVYLPNGHDLADCLQNCIDPDSGDTRETWLANTLLDAEALAQDRRAEIETAEIKSKLGMVA
ncbi:MAG: toprim domain-containing protein, partial [Solirubrobacterales bacterium]